MSGDPTYSGPRRYRGTSHVNQDKAVEKAYKEQLEKAVNRPDLYIAGKVYDGLTGKEIKPSYDWRKHD